jgi:hypothetical protein
MKEETRREAKKFWSAFEFLTDGYRDEFFFWESVVMFRKIVMTMLWTATLSSSDPYIGLMAAFFFVLLNVGISSALNPFETQEVNYVERHGLLTISLTFFLGLLMDNEASVRKVCPAGTLQAGSTGLNSCPANFACYLNSGVKYTDDVLQYPALESLKFSVETKWYRGMMAPDDRSRCLQDIEIVSANGDSDFCARFEMQCGMDTTERFVSFGNALDTAGNPVCKCSSQIEVGEKWGKNFREIGNGFATIIVIINVVWIARFFFLLLALTKKAYWEGIKKGVCGKIFKCCCNTMDNEMNQGKEWRQANDFAQEMVDDWMEVQDDDGNTILFNPFTGKMKPKLDNPIKDKASFGDDSDSSNGLGSDDDLNRDSGFFGENDDDGSASDDSEFGDGDVHQQAESNFEHADYKNPMLRQNNRSRLDANTLKALMKLKGVSGGKKKSQKIKCRMGTGK